MTNARDKANIPVLNFQSKGIDDNADATAITINSSEQVGIGTTSFDQDAKLTIATSGSGGANPSSISANTIATFRRTGGVSHNAMISVLGGTSGFSILNLGDRDDEDVGRVIYEHSSNSMQFHTNQNERVRIDATGQVGIGTSSPDTLLSLEQNNAPRIQYKDTSGGTDAKVWRTMGLDSDYRLETRSDNLSNGQLAYVATRSGYVVNEHKFFTSDSERMRIDSSGNVGIATTSIYNDSQHGKLAIAGKSGTAAGILIFQDTSNNEDGMIFADDGNLYIVADRDNTATSSSIRFRVDGSSEKMRIDSGGRLLVGTSSAPGDTDEVVIVGQATANGKAGMSVKAPTNHGAGNGTAIVAFDFLGNNYYSTSGKWGIYYRFLAENDAGSYADRGRMHFLPGYDGNSTTSGNGFLFRFNGHFTSDADDVADLGSSSNRWDDVYATNGTIQTSDQNEKQSIQSLTTAEMNVGKKLSSLIKTFKWNSSVEEKGDSARTHTGIIAQDVKQAFTDEGLDVANYALFISNTWWENSEGDIKEEATDGYTEKNRLGVRYSELLSFIQAYNDQRFTELEARITTLEANNP